MASTVFETLGAATAASKASTGPISARIRDAFVYVADNAKVSDALDAVRRSRMPAGQAAVVFIVNAQGQYKGYARLSELLRADPESTIVSTLEGADLAAAHDMDQEAAARRLQLKDVPLLPVVNSKREMIGVLTFDDAMDILEVETSDDIYFKAGVGDMFHALTSAHLRAFIYGDSMKPGRPALFDYPPADIAQAMARLPSEEAAHCLALLPAGVQIPVIMRLNGRVRDRLRVECADWARVIPLLRAVHPTVAQSAPLGQMTPVGRI